MRRLLTLTCLIAFAFAPALADAATKKKKRAGATPQSKVACTINGCHPIPPGCVPTMGYTWDGIPSGYDVVVCRRW